jgi:hypothetical protein
MFLQGQAVRYEARSVEDAWRNGMVRVHHRADFGDPTLNVYLVLPESGDAFYADAEELKSLAK